MAKPSKTKSSINGAVSIAKYAGLIKPVPCQYCGSDKNIYAHHCDYNKPLDVIFLCGRCHHAWHESNEAIQPSPEIEGKRPIDYYHMGLAQIGVKMQITGKELREWRTTKLLTQDFMANLLQVSLISYKKWESELRNDCNIPKPIALALHIINNHAKSDAPA